MLRYLPQPHSPPTATLTVQTPIWRINLAKLFGGSKKLGELNAQIGKAILEQVCHCSFPFYSDVCCCFYHFPF